jgi:hypothetical protein
VPALPSWLINPLWDQFAALLPARAQASGRWQVERTNAWHNAFNRLQRCYERRETVINAYFDLADTIITVRSMIRKAWTLHRWDTRPARRP